MAVLLSPVGGVAGQFFDNNGNPLSGGKIYSYVAGTTTPQATYTSSSGVTAHSNPIVLDSGGRVPGGEIWLTDGLQYKFVLKTSTDVLIGTYDNIVGINSNFVNFLTETEVQTATASQTVFTLATTNYQPGTNSLSVFVDGVNQYDGSIYAYTETSSTVVTFTSGLHVGALVKFTTAQTLSSGVTASNLVIYQPAGTGAVATTVQTKLRESVSVKDFGATTTDLTGVVNNAAFVAALAASNTVLVPEGTFYVTGNINFAGKCIKGESKYASIVKLVGTNTNSVVFYNAGSTATAWGAGGSAQLKDLSVMGNWNGSTANAQTNISLIGALVQGFGMASVKIQNCNLTYSYGFGLMFYQLGYSDFEDNYIAANGLNGVHLEAPNFGNAITSTSLLNNNINSNGSAGTYPVGGSGVYVKEPFSVSFNHNTIESSVYGITLDGPDGRSVTLLENHIEQITGACIRYAGAGMDLTLVTNIFATLPVFSFSNAAFNTYTAISNYNLPNSYNLPVLSSLAATQVYANAATPQVTINTLVLTPGTWNVSAGWIGVQSSGTGQASTRQEYALSAAASIPAYAVYYANSTLRADLASPVNTFTAAQGALSTTVTVSSGTVTMYLYGGPESITSTLGCAFYGWIQAVKVNGNYIS